MYLLETTRLSSKGQVVLPQGIRRKLHLTHGAKFVVIGEGDTVILKKITPPSPQSIKRLLRKSQAYARRAGLKPSDVRRAVRKVRRTSR
jgi:AbrB family looped-hinge helix DNA binding protein